jgi:ribose-phosphate pyrophosphokinase
MIKYQIIKKGLELFPILNLSKSLKYNIPNGQNITNYKHFTFPGGEEHFRIDTTSSKTIEDADLIRSADNMVIAADTLSSSGIMKTILATNAVRSINPKINITLFAPYFPYARQDRRMVMGEPFSLQVIANIINQQKYNVVEIFDPHSDVTPALIDNVSVIPNYPFVDNAFFKILFGNKYKNATHCIVSPDAGAEKKIFSTVQNMFINNPNKVGSIPVVCCTKERDVITGKILGSTIPDTSKFNFDNKVCTIVDDIIDGGTTFVKLAEKLKQRGAKGVNLIASHGILSGGNDNINGLKKHLDHIYITDSVNSINNDFITTISLLDILNYNDWYCTGKTREQISQRYLEK